MAQGVIRAATLAALSTSFNARYNDGVNRRRQELFWPRLASLVPSSTRTNIYPFMADIPGMKEWVGPRTVNQLSTRVQQLTNKDWEDTLAVPRDDILDDQYGLYAPRMELLGYQASKLPDDLLLSIIQGGTSATALSYDGVPYFSANHPVNLDAAGSPTQSNNFTGTPLTAANYDAVRQTMRLYRSDGGGRIMGYMPDLLIVPPQLEKAARDIVSSNLIAVTQGSGATAIQNTLGGTADVLVIPELGLDPLSWYLAVTKLPIKPLIWQERQAPQMQSLTNPDSDNVFWNREYVWGVDARGAAGYGMWFLMAHATG